MKKTFKIKTRVIMLIIIGILLVIYLAMLLSTNSFVEYFESVIRGDVEYSEICDTPFQYYYVKDNLPTIECVDANIYRYFVVHNFFEGYIWAKYDYSAYDADGNLVSAAVSCARWKIERQNGEWTITDIKGLEKWWR